jgi:integrase
MDDLMAYLEWAQAAGLSANTIEIRGAVLRAADKALPFGLLSGKHGASSPEIAAWLANPGWSRNTKRCYHGHLKAFFDWALLTDVIDWSPMGRLRRPAVPKRLPNPWTTEQFVELLRRARQPYRLAAVLAGYAGLRCCEISILEPGDVTETSIRICGKGGKTAVIDTHPRVWQELAPYGGTAPYLVQAGGRSNQKWLSRSAAQYFRKRLNLPVTLHMGRHWYGTEHYAAAGDMLATAAAMRHESISSTVGYTLLRNGQRRRGILALPVLDDAA